MTDDLLALLLFVYMSLTAMGLAQSLGHGPFSLSAFRRSKVVIYQVVLTRQ